MGENDQEVLPAEKDKESTQQEETQEEAQEETQEESSKEAKTEEKEKPSEEDNLTQKTIEQLEAKAQMKLDVLEKQKAQAEDEVIKYSQGKEEQIAAYEEHEQAIIEKDAQMAKENLEYESSKSVVDSMAKKKKELVNKNADLQGKMKDLESQQQKLNKKQEAAKAEIETLTKAIPILRCTPEDWCQFKGANEREAVSKEKELKKQESELQKYVQEAEPIPGQITELQAQIAALTEEIEKQGQEFEEKKAELQQKEAEKKKNQKALDEEKKAHKKEKPKDYDKFKESKTKLEMTNKQISNASEEKAGVKDRVANMERRSVDHGDAGTKDILVDKESGEAFGGDKQISADDSKVAEEVKLANSIKNAPIFKEVNKEAINKNLQYNPETGKHDAEEGANQDAPMIQQLKKMQEAMKANESDLKEQVEALKNNEEMKAKIEALKGNEKIASIEEKMSAIGVDKPISNLLDSLINLDFDACINLLQKAAGTVMAPDFRKNQPLIYNIMTSVYESVEPMLDIADKGDVTQDSAAKSTIAATIGKNVAEVIDKIITVFSSLLEPKEETEEDKAKKQEEQMNQMMSSGKDVLTNVSQARKASSVAKEFQAAGNTQYARALEGAKRQAISGGLTSAIDAVATGGDRFAGDESISLGSAKVEASPLINIAGLGLKKLAGWSVKKRDMKVVLNAPEVFGNVKYDEKKVPEDRFNQILREQTGITSRENVYNAIKTTDAIGLHASMMNSAKVPDPNIDRVMSTLGYQDRTKYANITVADIMKKTGHAPDGGDWRGELQKTLQVEGVDYKSTKQDLKDKVKDFAKASWGAIKGAFTGGAGSGIVGQIFGQIKNFASKTWSAQSGSLRDKIKGFAGAAASAIGGFF